MPAGLPVTKIRNQAAWRKSVLGQLKPKLRSPETHYINNADRFQAIRKAQRSNHRKTKGPAASAGNTTSHFGIDKLEADAYSQAISRMEGSKAVYT